MVSKLLKTLLLLLAIPLSGGLAQAQTVEAEGAARIESSVALAKRMALQDAIRQALMQANAQISTTTVTSRTGVVTDNMRFSAQGRVTHVAILREWSDNDHYYVKIRAQVPGDALIEALLKAEQGGAAGQAGSYATAEAANRYRRKVAVSQFHVLDRTQIHDLPNIETELARELERRLISDGRVLTVNASQYLLPLSEEGVISQRRILGALPPAREPHQVASEFAESLGVQFVVTGVIRDMSVSNHFLGTKIRHLELDLFIHDGISGASVARHRVSETMEEHVLTDLHPADSVVMSEKFFASPFGRKVDQMLDRMVGLIVSDVGSQPFTARVIRAEGNRVYFDAGGLANIRVGDVLNTYKLSEVPVKDYPGQRALGYTENPSTNLIVTQVQRLFSVGELAEDITRLAPGDVIRFEP
ncbi:MAG TPA: hypothetical protein ENI94_02425 [Gammaproteobacteria bacterium]|nr:hypothetical protein [Gammaproteobacteria bacterium]